MAARLIDWSARCRSRKFFEGCRLTFDLRVFLSGQEGKEETMRRAPWYIGLLILFLGNAAVVSSQTPSAEIKTAKLVKRAKPGGADNFAYATYSFAFGGNGPEVQKRCRNNWELLFGNSPSRDTFDVTMVTDDRSRIKDLGKLSWASEFPIPTLAAYEEPEREPSVEAVEGHMYLVHSRDTTTNLYTLFRVEKLEPGVSVEIGWKVIPAPRRP
jgi:hypothetical protein